MTNGEKFAIINRIEWHNARVGRLRAIAQFLCVPASRLVARKTTPMRICPWEKECTNQLEDLEEND